MIDESPAADEFKQVMRGKLDALLALAEATDCRRVRLLSYFGEQYTQRAPARSPLEQSSGHSESQAAGSALRCMNCDNCINPPVLDNATEAARKVLSCIYRVQQSSGMAFGAGHIMDILRGKQTDKMAQHGHDKLSTFGIGADLSEAQWRALLRQLIALEAVRVDAAHFNTLHLGDAARAILKGERSVWWRLPAEPGRASARSSRAKRSAQAEVSPDGAPLSLAERERLDALKAWRAEVAREHNLPAFVIFHDSTLREIACRPPATLDDLAGISGLGQKKLAAYGAEVLRVMGALA
jgi:ATP-dependent DNA helicase RecQ